MKRITQAFVMTAAAAALVVAVPAGNAAAINETACGPSDLLQINSANYGSLCFANGGTFDSYQIPNVISVSTGNNNVAISGPRGAYLIPKWSHVIIPNVTIDYISIR